MIKLIITDLEGSFLDDEGNFNEELYKKTKSIMDDQGVAFAASSYKQCERVEELFGSELSQDIWILGDSGTRIKHKGDYVYQSLMTNELALRIINKLENIAHDPVIIASTPEATIIKDDTPNDIIEKIRRSYMNVETISDYQLIENDFVKISVFDPKLACFESLKELEEFTSTAYIIATEASWIDITNHNVRKGSTVAELQAILGVTKAETMAFGDGLSDIELLQAADFSFAMRNAFNSTKAAAHYITGSNQENAVLKTIEHILSLQGNRISHEPS